MDVINNNFKLSYGKESDLHMPQIAMGSRPEVACPSIDSAMGDILNSIQKIGLLRSRPAGLIRYK